MQEQNLEGNGKSLTILACWKRGRDAELDAALIRFWLDNGALGDESQAKARLEQVAAVARTASGEIAGVCSAYEGQCDITQQNVFLYRSFIGPQWRASRLVIQLFREAAALLQEDAALRGYPVVGIELVLENARFMTRGADRPVWKMGNGVELIYMGKNSKGQRVRLHYFPRARLSGA